MPISFRPSGRVALFSLLTCLSGWLSPAQAGWGGVAVSPDGKRVYVTIRGRAAVGVIDATTHQVVAYVPVGGSPWDVAVTPDGKRIYVANAGSDTVSVIDAATLRVAATLKVGAFPMGLRSSPDGRQVYVANKHGYTDGDQVSVIDTATDQVVDTIKVGMFASSVAVAPDGKRVYVTDPGTSSVAVIDTVTHQVVARVSLRSALPVRVAASPDGTRVYVANHLNGCSCISVIDTAVNQVVANIGSAWPLYDVTVSPDGARVYAVRPSEVYVIDATSNRAVSPIRLPDGGANALAVSPDGSRLYLLYDGFAPSSRRSGTVWVVNIAAGTVEATIPLQVP